MNAALLTLLAALAMSPTPAQTSLACGTREGIVKSLKEKYDERGVSMAIGGLNVVEVFRTKSGSTWTILVTNQLTHQTCVVGAGKNWRDLEPEIEGDNT